VIVKFCGCMKKRLPAIITMDDLVELNRPEGPGQNLRKRVNALGKTFGERVIRR
jgi:hypothetical protein